MKNAPSNLPFPGSPPTFFSVSAYLALGFLLPHTFQLPLTQRSATLAKFLFDYLERYYINTPLKLCQEGC
jgi:hypothetical protein